MKLTRRSWAALGALGALVVLVVSLLPASAQQSAQEPSKHPATAGALPTPQTDGIVFAIEIVGNTAYVGGRFTKARPAGVEPGGPGEVPRHNLLAFDVRTGQLLPWAPKVSGSEFTSTTDPGNYCTKTGTNKYVCDAVFRIKASPGGSALYVGGDFDRIDGKWRSRIARFDLPSGALNETFKPLFSSRVRGLAVGAQTVYVGGSFSKVGDQTRTRLAAVAHNGTLRAWAPTADATVFALLLSPEHNRVLVGGSFEKLNGKTQRRMGAVSSQTGKSVSWAAKVNGSPVVTDIATDGTGVAYFSAYDSVGGVGLARFEGRMAAKIDTGQALWWDGCLGDTQAIAVRHGVIYAASHTHDCWASEVMPEKGASFQYYRLTAETTQATRTAPRNYGLVRKGDPIPTFFPWYPNTNGGPSSSPWKNGPWAVAVNDEYVVYGGEFTTVNGQPQQSLTRFAVRSVPGAVHRGPQTPFPAPTLSRNLQGKVVVKWKGTWSAQTDAITYQVIKVGTSEPIYEVTKSSRPWSIPEFSYTTSFTSGTFYIRAIDEDGNRIGSPSATI
ncbi:delta-60 repeat domain-containing protein [Thermocrispum agreste]|jgi:hypothetical protein|uniref:delta-60 repeat domain-containing protein n=1 Tax=Thermocrispum agreste TaxID=37925 RepID=UPI000422B708|nr:delta-60 repeat domain-containing protein [Thermocrispum agreste]